MKTTMHTTKNPQPKIHAYLATLGLGSRREIERWVKANEVKINGRIAELGQRVSPSDRVEVRGKLVTALEKAAQLEVIAYHKPIGEICTRAEEDRPTVFQALPVTQGRWISVGRLDINTSGLLLFTNDGDLAHRLMHPSFSVNRTYRVRVFGGLTSKQQKQMIQGVSVEGSVLKVNHIQPLYEDPKKMINQWFEVKLSEGKNREIRKLVESQGAKVSRLIRVEYGPIQLPLDLQPGQHRHLTQNEVRALHKIVSRKNNQTDKK